MPSPCSTVFSVGICFCPQCTVLWEGKWNDHVMGFVFLVSVPEIYTTSVYNQAMAMSRVTLPWQKPTCCLPCHPDNIKASGAVTVRQYGVVINSDFDERWLWDQPQNALFLAVSITRHSISCQTWLGKAIFFSTSIVYNMHPYFK